MVSTRNEPQFWVSDLGLASNAINLPSMNPYVRRT